MIINEDCLSAMKKMDGISVNVAYLDPPFFTQKTHKLNNGDGVEFSFDDTWDSMNDYTKFLRIRLIEVRRLLKDTGSVFLHCDSTASHNLRVLLDEVFGRDNFKNEIIWTYKRWSNAKKGLLNGHQTIFQYSKSKHYKFNTLFSNYSQTTNIDQILQDRVRNLNKKAEYKRDQHGNVVCTNIKNGVPLSDVWDIPFLNPKAKERVGYPTQKPILLLDRIIQISTDPDDVVLDPFCGSGTTLVSAMLLGRKFIGIDINSDAVRLANDRITNPTKTTSRLLENGIKSYDTKSDFEKQILSNFECNIVQRNRGIDAYLIKHYMGKHIPIRIQKDEETLSTTINLLLEATKSKCYELMIVIRTNDQEDLVGVHIPNNVMLIDSYQLLLKRKMK